MVELDQVEDGAALRVEMAGIIDQTSVPVRDFSVGFIFIFAFDCGILPFPVLVNIVII